MNIQNKIKERIKEKGLKIGYVGAKINVSYATMSQYIHGRTRIPAEKFVEICDILELSLDSFREDETCEIKTE